MAKKRRAANRASSVCYEKSVLDYALEDAAALQNKLGTSDRRKLEEYLTSVREIEQRVVRAEQDNRTQASAKLVGPTGIPKENRGM